MFKNLLKKKYQIALPVSLYKEVRKNAWKNLTSTTALFIRLLNTALAILKEVEAGSQIIVRKKGKEEIEVLFY